MSAAKLYTPEVLALATSLAGHPYDPAMPFTGQARSASCGSTLAISLRLDKEGRIAALGLRPQACAVGQASAALFAAGAIGQTRARIAEAEAGLCAWLAGAAPLPDWPGLAAIAPARHYPARHGAVMLAWRAALDALPTG
ncbi:iron-sulfur cluster assembly scaffold protein [Novosphingobium bradum]|uniref:Iron-sulfur cluster assembly scaffold protein n=1 Tax=Novosphingobium bradum TaxID=1737444 RepID=A0ABV7IUG4_9SPHN